MRLLIIESNSSLIRILRQGLRSLYYIDTARTGNEGLHEALSNSYDAIIMDLDLPGTSGLEICQQLRAANITTPILILTRTTLITRKVELLDSGADDYITRPFSMEELRARLRVLLRRRHHSAHNSYLKISDLVLNTSTRQVERAGVPIHLRRKEFEILQFMMHHAGMIVTRAMILDHAWERDSEIWANAVDVHIKHLRDKIDRPFGTRLIHTVYGIGYKIEALPTTASLTK